MMSFVQLFTQRSVIMKRTCQQRELNGKVLSRVRTTEVGSIVKSMYRGSRCP